MMTKKKKIAAALVALFAAAVMAAACLTACGEENNNDDPPAAAVVTSISLDWSQAVTDYETGDEFSAAGLKVTAKYSDGTEKTVDVGDCKISSPDMSKAGDVTITVTYEGKTASYKITIRESEPDDGRTDYRFEAEHADFGGGTVATENCGDGSGQVLRPDGTDDECVKDLFLGSGGYVNFRMFADKAAPARISLSIGTNGFNFYPEFDKYAKVYVNGEAVPTGIVYDDNAAVEEGGVSPWWVFQLYEMNADVQLKEGYNEISIRTYGYADITPEEGDQSAAAGGRNLGYIVVSTEAELTDEADMVGSITADASGARTEFETGDRFVCDGLEVECVYSDGTTRVLGDGEYEVAAPDMETEGKKTVTVTYCGKTATYEINVAQPAVVRTDYRFEAEYADYGGGTTATEVCGGWVGYEDEFMQRPDGSNDECVKDMFLGEGGYIDFRIFSDKAADARISLAIGTSSFADYPNFDDYARIYVNGEEQVSGIVYDASLPSVGARPWWDFQTYEMSTDVRLEKGYNEISVRTYGFAGITLPEGNNSAAAGGRNIGHIIVETDAVLTDESEAIGSISVDASGAQTEFGQNAAFSSEGIEVTCNYSDGTTRVLDADEYDVVAPDMTTTGEKTVTVSYGTFTATYDITVTEAETPPVAGPKDYRFEAEHADYGGGTVATENCGDGSGQIVRPDGTNDECVKDLFLGEGGYVTFGIKSDRAASARISLSIGTNGFNFYPEFDKYAKVYVNGEAVPTGIVYDAEKPVEEGGVSPWWIFQLYEMNADVQLKNGYNEISICTYGYADITPEEGDQSAAAGGRNLGYIVVTTEAALTPGEPAV